ncbi:hypothetical protein LTR53_005110 [Teratosphaeriaceae sp. CCFEE 6253]|nr:hypothetical protein LTR53_005110 [Teratosphaeriaceae sp. CCFEE 6253]
MSDEYEPSDKQQYSQMNGNMTDYIPFSYVNAAATAAAFSDGTEGRDVAMGHGPRDSIDLFGDVVENALPTGKHGSQVTASHEPIVLLLWRELLSMSRSSKTEPSMTFRFTKDEVIVQHGFAPANMSQKRDAAETGLGRPRRQRREH